MLLHFNPVSSCFSLNQSHLEIYISSITIELHRSFGTKDLRYNVILYPAIINHTPLHRMLKKHDDHSVILRSTMVCLHC